MIISLKGTRGALAHLPAVSLVIYVAYIAYASLYFPFPALVPLGSPTAYKLIYIHVPLSWLSLALLTTSFITALAHLVRAKVSLIKWTDALVLPGTIFAWASFITGTIWASESWGSPWSGDPRQLSVLVLAILYSLYPILRRGIEDIDRSRRVSAVYAVAAYVSVPITLVAPLVLPALHPPPGVAMSPELRALMYLSLAPPLALTYLVLRAMVSGIKPKWTITGLGVSLAIASVATAHLLMPYALGPVDRVVQASMVDGKLHLQLTGGTVTVNVDNVAISPLVIVGSLAIIGHLVQVRDGLVTVVTHWSVPINLMVATVATSLLLLIASRGLTKIYGDDYG